MQTSKTDGCTSSVFGATGPSVLRRDAVLLLVMVLDLGVTVLRLLLVARTAGGGDLPPFWDVPQ